MRRTAFAALLGCTAFACAASAATVTVVEGNVSINRGAGFKPVNGGTGAAKGDRVMAAANSVGQITYDNGCVEEVRAGRTVTVKEPPPCVPGATGDAAGILGGGVAPVVIGAALVGGVVAAIASGNNSGGGDAPASP